MLEAGVGDNGSFLIDDMEARLQDSGITVRTKYAGNGANPATGDKWETVDWRTISDGVDDTGKSEGAVAKIVGKAAAGFYRKGKPEEDKTVIDGTRRIDQRMNHCNP